MHIVILGGTGAMGSVYGAQLHRIGYNVTLYDTHQAAVDRIRASGLLFQDRDGSTHTLPIKATSVPTDIEPADVIIIFVKGMYTQAALTSAASFIQPHTRVISLQNGWGHADVISGLVNPEQVALGVTYASGVVLAPGHVKQVGGLDMFIGNLNTPSDAVIAQLKDIFTQAGFNPVISDNIVHEIWRKLALNVCTLPTTSIVRLTADAVAEQPSLVELMQGILGETIAVAHANNIPLDYDERFDYIINLLRNAKGGRSSMLQDFEAKRPTEIDFINGAIVRAGQKAGIPTPYNHAMVCIIKAIQNTYPAN